MPQEAQDHDAEQRSTDRRTLCEYERTLTGTVCEEPGEIRYAGVFVCQEHAPLLALEERTDILMGTLLSLDREVEIPEVREDELRLRRLKHRIEDIEQQLRINRLELDLARMQM